MKEVGKTVEHICFCLIFYMKGQDFNSIPFVINNKFIKYLCKIHLDQFKRKIMTPVKHVYFVFFFFKKKKVKVKERLNLNGRNGCGGAW